MLMPVEAEVLCRDGYWGHSTCLIVDPATRDVTHFVVRELKVLDNERLVPVGLIADTTTNAILLHCSGEELAHLPAFIRTHFVSRTISPADLTVTYETEWPEITYQFMEHIEEHIPPGVLVLHRGAVVVALDGTVGEVSELVIAAGGKHITHLILDENPMPGRLHVVVPVGDIQRIEKDRVYLNLTKDDIKTLMHYLDAVH